MDKVNSPDIRLSDVLDNILTVAGARPVVVQSLFPLVRGEDPSEGEIGQYVLRLQELQTAGAQISSVEVYSAHRPALRPERGHPPLACLSCIARRVRTETGIKTAVF